MKKIGYQRYKKRFSSLWLVGCLAVLVFLAQVVKAEETELYSSSTVPSVEVSDSPEVSTVVSLTEENIVQIPLYRLYHSDLKVHLYTKDSNEYEILATRGWKQEGVAWQTATQEGQEVYRLYHPGLKVHLYTKDSNEYQVLAGRGWKQEGVAYRSHGELAIYRLYHPGLSRHLYTSDANEYQVLANRGWHQEGVAFYGLQSGGQSVAIPNPDPTLPEETIRPIITVEKISSNRYRVLISNISASVEVVQVPVWSDADGQDDIKWYTAMKQSDGSYITEIALSNHRFDTGNYYAHVYAKFANNHLFIGETTFMVDDITQMMGDITVQNVNSEGAYFDVVVSDVFLPNGLKEIRVPVWSDADGQDDIQWYTATKRSDGSYQVRVDLSKHKYVFGDYTIHAYITQNNGKIVGIGEAKTFIAQPKQLAQLSVTYQGTGAFQLNFQRVLTSGKIRYAVWSDTGGQDDIRWYEATRTGDTSFVGRFTAQDHRGTGLYQLHAYQEIDGKLEGLLTATVHVDKDVYTAPYFSQLDRRWSGNRYGSWTFGPTGCVPTVMAMLISGVKGTTVTPDQVGGYLHHNTLEFNRAFLGTSSRGVVLSARNWGLRTETLNSVSDLSRALQEGYFVAAAVGSSKFILSGGHELLLKGYRDGNTYVMDPYNPNNNGWYTIQYLWNVQSKDPIDRTEGAPFIKVTD